MSDEILARVDRLELPFDARGVDEFGVSKWHLTVAFRALAFLHRNYFHVRCAGLENVPPRGRAMTSSQITAAPIMNSNARQGIQ